jgi:predicted membrane protein
MQQYDAGAPGDTLSTILYAVVPRILFPDKPMLTPGREFTTAITGQVGETATVPGVFAEAYWNGGWPMVVMICLLTGFLFWHYTSFAEKTVRYGLFQYLPVVMIGVTIGYSPADWFVSTFIGPTVNGVVLYVVIRFLIMPIIVSSALNIRPAPSAKFTSSPPTQ